MYTLGNWKSSSIHPHFCASRTIHVPVYFPASCEAFSHFFRDFPLQPFSDNLHLAALRAYSLFFLVGTFGAIQIPVVGMQPLRSLDAPANYQG